MRARGSADVMEAQARELLARAERARTRAGAIETGNEGERTIGALLDQLAGEGWVILHDRRKLPSSPANLDHIAVGPGGVFVIDAKNWTGGRVRLDDRGMAVGRWRKDDELHTVMVDADIVGRAVAAVRPGLPTTGVVAFVQDMGLTEAQPHRDVLVLQQEHLLDALRAAVPVLTATEVREVAERLAADFPPRAKSAAASAVGRRAADASPTSPPRQQRATADQRRATGSQQRLATKRERERRTAKRQLVTVAVILACIPAMPWAFEHVVTPVTRVAVDRVVPHLTPAVAEPGHAGPGQR